MTLAARAPRAPAPLRYRYLFWQMVRRELRQKYRGSALGVLWYFVNPVVLMLTYTLILHDVLRVRGIPDYPLFLLVGIVVWTFFSQSLLAASSCLIDQAALVRKVRFPRETVPAAVVTVQLVTFLVLLGLVTAITVGIRGTLDPPLLLLPAILVAFFGFVLGLSLAVAVLHAHFRDVAPILGAALLPWFFITPIFYRPSSAPGLGHDATAQWLLTWANPVAPFVEAVRSVLYDGRVPSSATLLYVLGAAALSLLLGRWVFMRMQRDLAVIL